MTLLNLSRAHPLGPHVGSNAISYTFGRALLARIRSSPACLEMAFLHGHVVALLQLEAFETIGWAVAEPLGDAVRYIGEDSPVRRRYERLPPAEDEPVVYRTTDARLRRVSVKHALRIDEVALNVVHDECVYQADVQRDDRAIFGALAHAVEHGRFADTPLESAAIPRFSGRGAMRLLWRVLVGADRAMVAEPYLEPGRRLLLDYLGAHAGHAPLPTQDDIGDIDAFVDRFFGGDDQAMGLPDSIHVDDAQALSAANELVGAAVHHRAAHGDVEGAVGLARAMCNHLDGCVGSARASALARRLQHTYTDYFEFERHHRAG